MTNLLREINGRKPDVVVVWGGSRLAEGLISGLPTSVSIDLSLKAAGFMGMAELQGANARVALGGASVKNQEFSRMYRAETGVDEGKVAQQIYVAILSVIEATQVVGANRARLRD